MRRVSSLSAHEHCEAETRVRASELGALSPIRAGPLEVLDHTRVTQPRRPGSRRGSSNRYYDPEMGRFITADPLGFVDGPSPYAFAGSNPVNFSDPLGLACPECRWTQKQLDRTRPKSPEEEKEGYSTLVGAIPVAGDVKDWQEAITGYDYVADQEIGWFGRALTFGAAAVPILPGRIVRELGDEIADAVRRGGKSSHADEVAEAAVEGTTEAIEEGIEELVPKGRRLPFGDADRLTEVDKTLDRIEAGGPFPYRKDGTEFRNRDGRLPPGNYREYTVDTPGAADRGTRRVVVDQDTGRTYYTDDHYGSFVQVDPELR